MKIGDFEQDIAPGDYIQSLDRGLAVIRAFNGERRTMSLAELSQAIGISRPSARRFLLTLQALGYVAQEGSRFRLLPRVLDLGGAYLTSGELPGIVNPFLNDLNSQAREACGVGVLDRDEAVYIARVSAQRRMMSFNVQVGTRIDPVVTSLGRVLLAHLDAADLGTFVERRRVLGTLPQIGEISQLQDELAEVREKGWILVDQVVEVGVRSIAVPLRNSAGTVIAGLNIAAHTTRVSRERLTEEFLPLLLQTQEQINTAFAEYGPELKW